MNHATPSPSEPLAPAPQWVHTPGAGWHDKTGRHPAPASSTAAAYAAGFEQGAFALAALLYPLAWSADAGKREHALRILRSYHDGLAHPVKGWPHELKRS